MEGIPKTVLRGHERDELGNVVAWKRKGTAPLEEEYEKISELHLEASSITSIRAEVDVFDQLGVFIQTKSGVIHRYSFKDDQFIKQTGLACGTFTFCRMSSLSLGRGSVILLAYPSHDCENAVNVLFHEQKYLIKNFMIASSGMCLFTRLLEGPTASKALLLCGYESGKLVLTEIDLETGATEILFEERVIEEGCTDADYFNDTIVAVGSSKEIVVIKNVSRRHVRTVKRIETAFSGFNSVCIRSDGKLFVTGGWDCKLRYFSLKSLKPLAVIEHHYEAISAVSIREEDFVTVAASTDGTISLWTLYSQVQD